MTKKEFVDAVYSNGNCILFYYKMRKFCIGYIPTGRNDVLFERIGIYEWDAEPDNFKEYSGVDALLEDYRIDDIPLIELLGEIKGIRGIPTA